MATQGSEIFLSSDNKVGALLRVLAPIKEAGIDVKAVCAWSEGPMAKFLIVTANNKKGIDALKKGGFSPSEKEVVLLTLGNKIGALAEATNKLAAAGVDIDHCYVSAQGSEALCVLATKDNAKVIKLFS